MMIFPIFVIVTLLEIYVLVSVGNAIGGFWTVGLVVLTALIGSALLKRQGWAIIAKAQQATLNGKSPALELLEGVVLLVSGVLLLTPGFMTDVVGLLGLMPISRLWFIRHILSKNADRLFTQKHAVFVSTTATHSAQSQQSPKQSQTQSTQRTQNTIEGEFWEDK